MGELEFALHSGRMGGASKLAEMGAQPWGVQREGKRAAGLFGIYEVTYEDPV